MEKGSGLSYLKSTRAGLAMSTLPVSSLIKRGYRLILGMAVPPSVRRTPWIENLKIKNVNFGNRSGLTAFPGPLLI